MATVTRDPEPNPEPDDDERDDTGAPPPELEQPVRVPTGRKFGPDGLPIGFERKVVVPDVRLGTYR